MLKNKTPKKTYFLFHIIAHDGNVLLQNTSGINVKDRVDVRVISSNCEEALEKAKSLVKRKEYILLEIIEYVDK